MVDTIVVALTGCVATVFAYLLGWHRGQGGFPITGSRRPAPRPSDEQLKRALLAQRTAAVKEKMSADIEAKRETVRDSLKKKYPEMMPQDLDRATSEILEKAKQTLGAGRIHQP